MCEHAAYTKYAADERVILLPSHNNTTYTLLDQTIRLPHETLAPREPSALIHQQALPGMLHKSLICITLAVLCSSACSKRNAQIKRFSARDYNPPELAALSTAPTEELVLRVQVKVDARYRKENLRWRQRIERQLEAASAELSGTFRIRLDVARIDEWEHDSAANDLEENLRALASDPVPEGIDRVIGFTSSLPSYTSDQHALGMAHVLGQHLIMRGMNSHIEYDRLDEVLSAATPKEREELYKQRVLHKETTVLLHELGHTLGALHLRVDGYIMSKHYSHKVNSFAPANVELMKLAAALRHELGPEGERTGEWQRRVHKATANYITENDVVARDLDRGSVARYVNRPSDKPLTPTELDHLRELTERSNQRDEDHATIWSDALALATGREDDPTVTQGLCFIRTRIHRPKQTPDPAHERWCQLAAKTNPDSLRPDLMMAMEHHRLEDYVLAQKHLDRALEKQGLLRPREHQENQAYDWFFIAYTAAHIGALTIAEQSLERVPKHPSAPKLRAQVTRSRRELGLFGVPTETEVPTHAILIEFLTLQNRASLGPLLDELGALAPDTPALAVARCVHTSLQAPGAPDTLKRCEAAVTQAPDAYAAHYFSGHNLLVRGKVKEAITSFERTIELIPEDKRGWDSLARAYKQNVASAKLEMLRVQYERQFGAKPSW